MDIKLYTDDKYIPINQMDSFDESFILQTKKYRQKFLQMIKIDDLHYVNLVETPSLIKKRFIKNVEIKEKMKEVAKDNDFILMLAKAFINNQKLKGISFKENNPLRSVYKSNNNDLTIVTSYIIENIWNKEFITWSSRIKEDVDLQSIIPELSNNETHFIEKYNKKTHSYTLNDFQKLTHTSYETARKSLEKLKTLKLYIKNKVGKKYVYSPTEKLIYLLEGGA